MSLKHEHSEPLSAFGVIRASALMALEPAERDARTQGIDLFFATAEGTVEQVEALLVARVDPNFRDYERRCPLHVAVTRGQDVGLVQMLIDHRADVHVMNCLGQTPLSQAVRSGNVSAETLLRENGAKLEKLNLKEQSEREKWAIQRSEVLIGEEITHTLKSVVHRATWKGIDVVAKLSLPDSKDITPEELEDEMLHEIALLATVRHPDLVMFLGCCLEESPIMFISEFMSAGDLEHYYASKQTDGVRWSPPTKTVNRWGRAILRALDFLHNCSQPIIHRDLKPMNILLTQSLEVKVTDFGISKVTRRCSSSSSENYKAFGRDSYSMTGGVGSWRYMAPEVARHEPYTEKVDVYSSALILYFMNTGRQPFHEYKDARDVLDEYAKGNEPRPNLFECDSSFRRIMEAAWDKVPEKRPSAADLVERLVEIHNVRPSLLNKCTCTFM